MATTPQLDDIITEDGILSNVLSKLLLAEAVRTSVLSPRWKNIWTQRSKFNFNAISVLGVNVPYQNLDSEEAYRLIEGKTDKFIQSVNSVLQQLQGAIVHDFTVSFFLDKTHSQHIDAWVRFAVASKTKKFRLHFMQPFTIQPELYVFPSDLLGLSWSLDKLWLAFCSLKLPIKFDGLTHLKLLALAGVAINSEDFNRILSNCSSTLIKLFVAVLWDWEFEESITIPHPLSQLQKLQVRDCFHVRNIEMDAPNLVKLIYKGVPADFRFRQSKKLIDANICFDTGIGQNNLESIVTKLANSLPHLQSLTLKVSDVSKVTDLPKSSSSFSHLKRLDWEWEETSEMSLFHLATVIDASLFLEEFNLQLSTTSTRIVDQPPRTPTKFKEMLPKRPLTHLMTIRISDFYFDAWQLEIAVYLLNIATQLKSMTIEKGSKTSWIVSEEINERGMDIIKQEAPTNVKLVFS